MKITTALLLGGALATSHAAFADDSALPGYAPGATVMRVQATQGQIDELTDVIYSQVKQTRSVRAMRMTLLVPRTNDLKPAIVYYPGGGFTSTDYNKFYEMREALAKAGFVVAAAEYRVIPDTFPALVEDGKAAVRYLRAHAAQYGIDPTRIGVLGDSAGGYVAQMMGTTNGDKTFDKGDDLTVSSDVQAVVSMYGISNLANISEGFPADVRKVHQSPSVTEALLIHGPAFGKNTGATIADDPDKVLAASPMGHLNGTKPPFLILHGSSDPLVSPVQSKQLYQALRAKGDKAEFVLVEGAKHGDITWYQPPVINKVVDWFKQSLGAPIKGAYKSIDPSANL